MPFKSQKQRGWMYENKPKMAKEFEEATPEDMKLPKKAKKMSEGGEVEEEHKTMLGEDATLVGLRDLLRKAQAGENIHEKPDFTVNSSTKNYAGGGEVHALPNIGSGGYQGAGNDNMQALMSLIQSGGTSPFLPGGSVTTGLADASAGAVGAPEEPQPIDPTNIPAPVPDMPSPHNMIDPSGINPPSASLGGPPSLSDTTSSLNKTPDTNYDFYGDVGADKRKALYDQLMTSKRGPGELIAQGLGGIGDAISNSFGGQHNTYMKDIQGRQDLRRNEALGAFDTQRQQKLQDMQGNQEQLMNDPKHPIAIAMQKMLRSSGIMVPSGMSAKIMLQAAGPMGELAFKKASVEATREGHQLEAGTAAAERGRKEEEYASEHPLLNYLNPVGKENPTSPISNPHAPTGLPSHGVPELGTHFNGGKVLKVTRVK